MAKDRYRINSLTIQQAEILQDIFDRSRAFDFSHLDNRQSSRSMKAGVNEGQLKRIEFITLALAGEIGEFANKVKKTRRAVWMGKELKYSLQEGDEEIGDIFAYLLKLSNVLGKDLDEMYLEKVSDNYVRFPVSGKGKSKCKILTISGPPGSGKTSVVNNLSKEFQTYTEDVKHNPFIQDISRKRNEFRAVENQNWFLDRLETFLDAADPTAHLVIDQDPAAIVKVYCRLYRDNGSIDCQSYMGYLKRLIDIEIKLNKWGGGRQAIMLDAPAEILFKRVKETASWRKPPLEWFESVRNYFQEFRKRVGNIPTLDTNRTSSREITKIAINSLTQ